MTAIDYDERRIDALFADLDQAHLPGAAVGIAIQGKPVYRKGFGLASMELPVVLSPSMRMRIYSTTKHFACLAYLLLCEEGRACIGDPLGKYFPELHPVTHGVTMRQLMGNTGGLRDPHDLAWQFGGTGQFVSSSDLFAFYRDVDDVNFAPGTAWCYGNGGFLLLSFVIERITGQPLETVLQERIFAPVGMHDTLLRRTDTDFVSNSATMHMKSRTDAFDRSYVNTELAGEAGAVSTVDDMLRWLSHMDAPRVGSSATWEAIRTPQVLCNGGSTGYGMGLMIGRYRGIGILHHAGGGQGASSQMLKVPSAGLDVVVMANRHDVASADLTNRILDACLPKLDPPRDAARGPCATGVFRSPDTDRILQLKAAPAGHAWIEAGSQVLVMDGFDIPVEPDSDGVLRPTVVLGYMQIAVTLLGERWTPHAVRLDDFGNVEELRRVEPAQAGDLRIVQGEYRSATTGTRATILEAEAGLRLHTVGRFGSASFSVECLAHRIWRAVAPTVMSWGGILSFDADGAAFRFTSLRTRALPFQRHA